MVKYSEQVFKDGPQRQYSKTVLKDSIQRQYSKTVFNGSTQRQYSKTEAEDIQQTVMVTWSGSIEDI